VSTVLPVVAGALTIAVGAAGLVRSAVPERAAASTSSSSAAIVVTGAYVRAPVAPTDVAAAYFTVRNTSSTPDQLTSVETGAGATAVVHAVNSDGSMSAAATLTIPAKGSVTLATGKGHVMIEKLFGTLRAGQSVNIELDFAEAGSVDVVAPVVAVGAPVPVGGHS
jgi:periplasmic copper chaperone A